MNIASVDDHIASRLALFPAVQHLQQPHQVVDMAIGELPFAIVDDLRPNPSHRRRKQHGGHRRAKQNVRAIVPLLQRSLHHLPLLGAHQSRVPVNLILRTTKATRPTAVQEDGTDITPANSEPFVVEHLDVCIHLDVLPQQSLVLVIHLQSQDANPKLRCDGLTRPLEWPIPKIVYNVMVVVKHHVASVGQSTTGVRVGPRLAVATPILLDDLLAVRLPLLGILGVTIQHEDSIFSPVSHALP
mmetsp:Transcript_74993/g.171912  ORF Transcript_74993/g.171912 Transcript_74993/m.171912 type:complete len:243 (+) Transcript_74993:1480-2208(+)